MSIYGYDVKAQQLLGKAEDVVAGMGIPYTFPKEARLPRIEILDRRVHMKGAFVKFDKDGNVSVAMRGAETIAVKPDMSDLEDAIMAMLDHGPGAYKSKDIYRRLTLLQNKLVRAKAAREAGEMLRCIFVLSQEEAERRAISGREIEEAEVNDAIEPDIALLNALYDKYHEVLLKFTRSGNEKQVR